MGSLSACQGRFDPRCDTPWWRPLIELLPILSVLLAVVSLPLLGFRYAARTSGATWMRRIGGAVVGGVLATGTCFFAAWLSDPAIEWGRYGVSLAYPMLLAIVLGLAAETKRWLAVRRES